MVNRQNPPPIPPFTKGGLRGDLIIGILNLIICEEALG